MMNLRTFLNDKMKKALFIIIIFGVLDGICFLIYFFISSKIGIFDWTIENQISTGLAGQIIQVINLITMINGIVIFIYIVVFVILAIKG